MEVRISMDIAHLLKVWTASEWQSLAQAGP